MFKKKVLSFLILGVFCLSLGMFAVAGNVSAAGLEDKLRNGIQEGGGINTVAEGVYGTEATTKYGNLENIVTIVINAILGLIGMIFLVLTVYAGFLWMTAQGNEDNVTKAKSILTTSIIGLIIIVAAYAITNFIITAVTKTT